MTVEELRGCPLFRDIAPEDLQAMLGCLSAGRPRPAGGTSSCGPLTRIPCWVWSWRGRWR